jgi:hypothetical protein
VNRKASIIGWMKGIFVFASLIGVSVQEKERREAPN